MLGDLFPGALRDRVRLLRLIGYQVTIKELTGKIQPGYIGVLSYYRGGILEFREYLKLQVELVEKTTIVFQRTGGLVPLSSGIDPCSIYLP
jgi:hypothetical protein